MDYLGNQFGLLLVDKPAGLTSHDVVNQARKVLKTKTIGHTGTLDPFATGLLVLAIGRATKLMPYLNNHDKTYEAMMILGLETDTLDPSGKVVREENCENIRKEAIFKALEHYTGTFYQEAPAYSAVKVAGRKLYEYQRKGLKIPAMPQREVSVYSYENIDVKDQKAGKIKVSFTVKVSKGTYIRQLAKDLGAYLNIPASLVALKRITSGPYSVTDAIPYEKLMEGNLSIIDPLAGMGFSKIVMSDDITKKIDNGAFVEREYFPDESDTIIYDKYGKPVAIYRFDPERKVMRMAVKLL